MSTPNYGEYAIKFEYDPLTHFLRWTNHHGHPFTVNHRDFDSHLYRFFVVPFTQTSFIEGHLYLNRHGLAGSCIGVSNDMLAIIDKWNRDLEVEGSSARKEIDKWCYDGIALMEESEKYKGVTFLRSGDKAAPSQ